MESEEKRELEGEKKEAEAVGGGSGENETEARGTNHGKICERRECEGKEAEAKVRRKRKTPTCAVLRVRDTRVSALSWERSPEGKPGGKRLSSGETRGAAARKSFQGSREAVVWPIRRREEWRQRKGLGPAQFPVTIA